MNSYENKTGEIINYGFRCGEKGKKEIEYNRYTGHILPGLEPLERGESFRFEVDPLPKINAKCKVSVLYYDDKKLVDVMDSPTLDISESEYKEIEKAKKSTNDLTFEIDNKK